jgi:hypothetical protein
MESGHQVRLGILKFKILFTSMFTYMKLFDFVIITYKSHMFKVSLYIFIKIKQTSQLEKFIKIQGQVD